MCGPEDVFESGQHDSSSVRFPSRIEMQGKRNRNIEVEDLKNAKQQEIHERGEDSKTRVPQLRNQEPR